MSLVTETESFGSAAFSGGSHATPADYIELLKPRVMSLVIFTALAGMAVAPGHIDLVTGFASLLAIAIGAGASGALNMAYDADIDAIMTRTAKRPIPEKRVSRGEATGFGVVLSVFSVMLLGLASNALSAALLAGTILFYAVVYTIWLKRWTPQNIVIGGAAGALPPMIGYAVVTGSVTLDSLILFGIIFLWTPPHFWALALVKSDEYARVGIPMMPNVKGPDRTRTEMLAYSVALVPVTLAPWATGAAGAAYGIVALVSGALMLALAVRVYRCRTGSAADKAAMQLFGYSILYLMVLFAMLLAEHSLALAERFHW